jgi:glycine dehydrogenase subunit 1
MTAATIYLSLLGAEGLERVALACHDNLRQLLVSASKSGEIERVFKRPVFHEKVLRLPVPAQPVLAHMAENGVLAGVDLSPYYPELGNAILVCATETKNEADINKYAAALNNALQATALGATR